MSSIQFYLGKFLLLVLIKGSKIQVVRVEVLERFGVEIKKLMVKGRGLGFGQIQCEVINLIIGFVSWWGKDFRYIVKYG